METVATETDEPSGLIWKPINWNWNWFCVANKMKGDNYFRNKWQLKIFYLAVHAFHILHFQNLVNLQLHLMLQQHTDNKKKYSSYQLIVDYVIPCAQFISVLYPT